MSPSCGMGWRPRLAKAFSNSVTLINDGIKMVTQERTMQANLSHLSLRAMCSGEFTFFTAFKHLWCTTSTNLLRHFFSAKPLVFPHPFTNLRAALQPSVHWFKGWLSQVSTAIMIKDFFISSITLPPHFYFILFFLEISWNLSWTVPNMVPIQYYNWLLVVNSSSSLLNFSQVHKGSSKFVDLKVLCLPCNASWYGFCKNDAYQALCSVIWKTKQMTVVSNSVLLRNFPYGYFSRLLDNSFNKATSDCLYINSHSPTCSSFWCHIFFN